jgi:TonB family protein
VRRAKIHVRSVWVVPPGFRTQPLQTSVLIDLDAEGRVLGKPRIIQRSGNYHYDDGVVRAIRKASPLPAPPESGEWTFVFVPEDSY